MEVKKTSKNKNHIDIMITFLNANNGGGFLFFLRRFMTSANYNTFFSKVNEIFPSENLS